MSRVLSLLLVLSLSGLAWADEEPKQDDPSPAPMTAEAAADAVLEASISGDGHVLATLAARDRPDPWVVVETLLHRGEADAAARFSRASSRPDTARLPAYVAARREDPPDEHTRDALARMRTAVMAGDGKTALTALEGIEGRPGTISAVRLATGLAIVLHLLGRDEESVAADYAAADRAEAIGWWARAAAALERGAIDAHRRSDFRRALAGWERLQGIREMREDHVGAARALANTGTIHNTLGNLAQARSCQERALALLESLGDRVGVAKVLGSLGNTHESFGNLPEALAHQERALSLSKELGYEAGIAKALASSGNIYYLLGDHARALSTYERARSAEMALGNESGASTTLANLGLVHTARGDYANALSCFEGALAEQKARGDRAGMCMTLGYIGTIHFLRGDYVRALSFQERSLALAEAQGRQREIALRLAKIAAIHSLRGEYAKALAYLERSTLLHEATGDRRGLAGMLVDMASNLASIGDYSPALSLYERAMAILDDLGLRGELALTLANTGNIHVRRGDLAKALSCQERGLAILESLGDRRSASLILNNIGGIHQALGDYARALACHQRALAELEDLGDRAGAAKVLGSVGAFYQTLGDPERALTYLERALSVQEALGARAGAAWSLRNIGECHRLLRDLRAALKFQERALASMEALGDRRGLATVLGDLGLIHQQRGDFETARSHLERSLALHRELGDRPGAAVALGNLGGLHARLGGAPAARKLLGQAVREARRLRARRLEVRFGADLAWVRLRDGQAARALMGAQQALRELEDLLGGLAEEEGASARSKFSDLFGVGALAAARLAEPAEALAFLESGRAGLLLETLGGGGAVRYADLPAALTTAETQAKAREARVRRQYGLALETGNRRAIRKAAKAVDEAMEERREVSSRIQREAKRVADVFYPRAATLEEIQGWMEPGTSLVLYGLCLEEALALVVTPEGERIVSLGSVKEVEAASLALACDEPTEDASANLAALRALLVEPLALGDDVTTVLISPDGALGYVPWGALLDRPVACVPSGTTWVLLREEEREPGRNILSLGDPDYVRGLDDRAVAIYTRGGRLTPLPATREEATAIGDVVLLGREASEPALTEALQKEKRWRAVHLACHGLVDAERPTLSSLALTPAGDEDGFLTCLEIFRMRIPADLVTLSACETAKGRVVRAEGIVGLTRAFMYAGAPRVLCSLWKVDDEATRALMTKFYALWNPKEGEGLPAAEALRQAQQHVAAQEKWAHPYYWAAWVLWGLAE